MINKKTWKDFQNSGLLWWTNQILHTFGWALVLETDKTGNVTDAYPARIKYRGFDSETNDIGYHKVSHFLKTNAEQLANETIIKTKQNKGNKI